MLTTSAGLITCSKLSARQIWETAGCDVTDLGRGGIESEKQLFSVQESKTINGAGTQCSPRSEPRIAAADDGDDVTTRQAENVCLIARRTLCNVAQTYTRARHTCDSCGTETHVQIHCELNLCSFV